MSFNTMLEGTSVGVTESAALPRMVAGVPIIVPAAGAEPVPGSGPRANCQARLEVGAGRWIKCDDGRGVVELHDPRLFRRGRKAFCYELAKAAVKSHQALRVEIRLTSSLCRLEFGPGRFNQSELAGRVAAAVRAATLAAGDGLSGASHNGWGIWTNLTAFATDAGASVWETQEDRPGHVVLYNRARETPARAEGTSEAPTGPPRLVDLALFGGSVVLAVAGVIVPGIPTLPFVLLAGHHAVRLSPRLRRFLMRQPWFVALRSKADGMEWLPRLDRRTLLKLVGITFLSAAVFLIVRPPLPLVLGLELGLMAYFVIRKMVRSSHCEVGLPACA